MSRIRLHSKTIFFYKTLNTSFKKQSRFYRYEYLCVLKAFEILSNYEYLINKKQFTDKILESQSNLN